MSRRRFLGILSGAAASWTLCARAQQETKIPRIGLLAPGRSEGADASRVTLNSLVAGLRELGYTEGQNIVIERRFGESNPDRLRKVTDELIELKVDVIVALSTTAARPAKQATSRIPIVAIGMADPVEDELVASLARPGGNVTGTSFLGPELVAKRLQLLGQVVPQLVRVAVLLHPRAYSDRTMDGMSTEIERAAQTLGMKLQLVPAAGPEDIAGAFSAMARERAAALSLFPSPMLFAEYGRIASLAAENRLPVIYAAREGPEVGGLMSYGANLPDLSRQTATYVDKILKGTKPAELPVQQPTKFELVINRKTAKALGLAIPSGVFSIADEVIE
jgi:putative tryptophan/tyrosine transport system substrate-binding protein